MSDAVVKKLSDYDKMMFCEPDKSISVRAVILNSYAVGKSTVKNLSVCDDVLSAVECMRRLGAKIELEGSVAHITGAPFCGCELDCGNSATAARLLTGLLSGLNGVFTIVGDRSLSQRPMDRITEPLARMGAQIGSSNGCLPLKIVGRPLHGIDHNVTVASAQVKSALILAGLNAAGRTRITQRIKTRDHTENMLKSMNAFLSVEGDTVNVDRSILYAADVTVPGDVSAAAYPLCLALMTGGRCTVKSVGLNPTRIGFIDVLKRIGADVSAENVSLGAEPYGDITVKSGKKLEPIVISGKDVASVIDEIPVLCALACFIEGVSVVDGAEELRAKESDRIKTTVAALKSLGADIEETSCGMIIRGGKPLKYGTVDCCGDHRIAMTAAVAGAAGGGVKILGADCVAVGYPHFFEEVLGV